MIRLTPAEARCVAVMVESCGERLTVRSIATNARCSVSLAHSAIRKLRKVGFIEAPPKTHGAIRCNVRRVA